MKKYTFLVFYKDYDAFLTLLRNKGVVHVSMKQFDREDDQQLQQLLAKRADIVRLLNQGCSDELLREKNMAEQQLQQLRGEINRMSVWGDFDNDQIQQLKERGYELTFYSCSKKIFQDVWGIKINEDKDKVYFVALNQNAVPETCQEQQLNAKSSLQLSTDFNLCQKQLEDILSRIQVWKKDTVPYLQTELREVDRKIEWQNVHNSTDSVAEGSLCLLEGFCPENDAIDLNKQLDENKNLALYYQCSDPQATDTPPIKLRNNGFIKMFESLTGMYGLPKYSEFDPTPILGPFFLLFFALCIGDAGYGLLLILIGWLIHKDKLKIEMFAGLGPIIMALGCSSTVIGYLMGTFFGIDLFAASWLPETMKTVMFKNFGNEGKIGEYDIMMVLALIIGVVHICLAMIIKAICYTKNLGFKENISTWSWLLLILGAILTSGLMLAQTFSQEVIRGIVIGIGGLSALGIFIFNKPDRNPLINIGAGLWDAYGMVTGLLGDVLSYIRLYALGLAGGMLGMAFNQLGTMVLGEHPNVGTMIGFGLIVTFGHILNLLMACLGAFVHPLRLTFVEYFKNAGYQGTGKKYEPFRM